MLRVAAAALLFLALGLGVTILVAQGRWRARTDALIAQLDRVSAPPAGAIPLKVLDGLPPPVARYFRAVLGPEVQPIARVRVVWRGEFLTRPPDGWQPFHATQVFCTRPAGFVWDARVRMGPGLTVFVRDASVSGAGSMRAAALGLIPVLEVGGTPEIAAAALQRYLGEAVWFPVALLPAYGVRWDPVDSARARATLETGGTSVALEFRFGADSLVETIYAPARFREVKGAAVPTPWEARVGGYAVRNGLRIPLSGEAAWLLPEGRAPYWRGEVVDVAFQLAVP